MAARSLGTGAAIAMNLLFLISRSQRTRPWSVVYGEGVDDDADGVDIACADADAGEALAQRLRRSEAAAVSGRGSRRGIERRRGAAAMSHGARGLVETVGGCDGDHTGSVGGPAGVARRQWQVGPVCNIVSWRQTTGPELVTGLGLSCSAVDHNLTGNPFINDFLFGSRNGKSGPGGWVPDPMG